MNLRRTFFLGVILSLVVASLLGALTEGLVQAIEAQEQTEEATPTPIPTPEETPLVDTTEESRVTIDVSVLWQNYNLMILAICVVVVGVVLILRPLIIELGRQVSPEVFDITMSGVTKALKDVQKKTLNTPTPVDNLALSLILERLREIESKIYEGQGRPDAPLQIPLPEITIPEGLEEKPENPPETQ